MDTSRINELKNRASGVKNATVEGENTADRIGQLMYDMIDYDGQQSESINALERKTNNIQEQIDEIIEGGGGGGTAGKQKTFFLNISHGVVPVLPTVNEYSSSENAFVHGTQIWKETNTDPESGQDTYMMWSWFVGESPQSTSGPVKIYDGASSGSNGEDANETEWVYRVVSVRPTAEILAQWTQDLSNAKGSQGTGGINYTQADAVPPSWNDHPTGIDENNKYEYASYRVSTLDSNGKRVWGTTGFSEPILWASYGERGTDGDGVEYIFYADKDGRLNPDPVNNPRAWTNDANFQNPEYIREGSSWVDEPVDLGAAGYGQGSVQWVSMRKKQNSVWQAYSEPAVWSRLGKDGVVDGYTVDLSNENMPVGTSSDGTVTNWSNSSLVQVFHNSTPMTYDGNAGTTPAAGHFNYKIGTITRSDDPDHEASGFRADKNDDTVVVRITTVTHFNEVSATVPITIYLPGGVTRELVITVFGVATGEAGQFIDMILSSKAIRSNYAGTEVSPTTVSIGVIIGERTYYSQYGSPEGSAESKGYSFKYRYDETGSFISQAGPITVDTGHSTLTVNMYKKEGTSEILIDSENIPFVKDGKNGEDSPYYVEDYGISASRTDHSDITDSDWRPTQPIPTSEKPYVWKRSRLYNPSTQKYGDPIYVCLTGEKGPGGGGGSGEDGWMILASPANVILTQSLDNTSRFSSATVSFMAKKGNVTVNIDSIDSPTGVYFNVRKSGKTVIVTSPQPLGDSYYTEGSFKVNIYVKDPDTNSTVTFEDITVPCYANLLGTWKQSVEAGEETIAASQIVYAFGASGSDIETIKTDYNSKRNSIGDWETWSRSDNTSEGSKTWMNNHISTAEQNISRVEKHIPAPNLFDSTDWTYNDTNFPLAEKDTANNRFYDKTYHNDIFSPIVRLEAGTYTFSAYVRYGNFDTGTNSFAINYISSGDPRSATTVLAPSSVGPVNDETKIINGITYHRRYAVFTINSIYYVSINLWGTDGSVNYADVAYPKLEKGGVVTNYFMDSASVIKQTADEIKLAVNDAGIDITNKTIHLYGDKVTFSDREGGNTDKIWIDPDKGTLHAKNGVFSGTVNANLFYGRTLTVTTSPYTIDPSTNPYNMYLYNSPNTDRQLYLPNAATYGGLEINVFVVPPGIIPYAVRVYAGSEKIQAMNNYHIAKDNSSDHGIVVRGYDADASLFTTSYVVLRTGVKYTFKSINGTWYVLDGLCNSGDR